MNKDILVKQLVAAKAASESVSAGIDAALCSLVGEEEATTDEECTHPKNQRQKLPVMGENKGWFCKICGHIEEVNDGA